MTAAGKRVGLGISNCRPLQDVVKAVRRAEALGAEIAFIAEDVNCRDAFQLCALSARETERMWLATGVVNPYTRNPTSLAMAIATLDELSGGRAVLGLGSSSPSLIEAQMGILGGSSVGVMREAVEIVRLLLTGEVVTYAGQRFRYTAARLEVRPLQARIPIYFAAMGPRMLRLAGALADGVLLNVGASTEYVRWAAGQIRDGATAVGRDASEVTVAAWLSTYITEDREAGLLRARAWLATMLSIPRQGELLLEHSNIDTSILSGIRAHVSGYPHRGDPLVAAQFVPPAVAERLALVGSVDEVRARVTEYRTAGVDIPVFNPPALRVLLQQ